MAELNKKLYIQQANGTVESCTIYSTQTEAGDKCIPCEVDNVLGYISIGNTTDATATHGRISIAGKYYKYIYTSWTQPTLSSNGTMGGASFACDQSSYYESGDEPAQLAFYVFDDDVSSHEWQINTVDLNSWYWLSWYNPVPIKISQIVVTNSQENYVAKAWILQGCDDNSSWEDLSGGTNTATAGGSTWTITVADSNQKAYKYHRIYCQPNNTTALMIKELNISAAEQTLQEVSESDDYDYSTGETVYAIKSIPALPYTEQSWTTAGTYSWTAPSGVKKVRVAVCGGGGGCALMAGQTTGTITGTAGGLSRFGTVDVAGGGQAVAKMVSLTTSTTTPSGNTSNTTRYCGVQGNAGVGGRSGSMYRAGALPSSYTFDSFTGGGKYSSGDWSSTASGTYSCGGGYALSFTEGAGDYGSGGTGTASMTSSSSNYQHKAGSGSGYYNTLYVDVVPGNTYEVIVGSGGTSVSQAGNYGSASVSSHGASGFVLIAYGGDIQ